MKKVMVETNRMNIYPLSLDRMDEVIKNEPDEEMKKAYGEMKEGCEKHPEQYVWYAIWYMELKAGNIPVGDLCFKGLEENGSVEIVPALSDIFSDFEEHEVHIRTLPRRHTLPRLTDKFPV